MSAILKYEVDEPEPETARELIRLENVTKTYDSGENAVTALNGVNLTIDRGEFSAIIGPSGSGKSTLMHILGCLDSPSGGSYWLEGEDVATMSARALARVRNQRIGFVFQTFIFCRARRSGRTWSFRCCTRECRATIVAKRRCRP